MRARTLVVAALLLVGLCLPARMGVPGWTRVVLADAGSGRVIASGLLRDGEEVVLTWTNSLFGQFVTETLVASSGSLVLTRVTFTDPCDPHEMRAAPAELNDLYHTGGAFSVQGLSRPVTRVVFLVGEIGRPKARVGHRTVDFEAEVGFGGRVLLTAGKPSLYQRLISGFPGVSRWPR